MYKVYYLDRLIDIFVGIAELILLLRVLFRLFNASASSPFVHWIYETSSVLMTPFRGIFPPAIISPGYTLDVSALFTMLMYAIIGYILIALLGLVPAPTRRIRER